MEPTKPTARIVVAVASVAFVACNSLSGLGDFVVDESASPLPSSSSDASDEPSDDRIPDDDPSDPPDASTEEEEDASPSPRQDAGETRIDSGSEEDAGSEVPTEERKYVFVTSASYSSAGFGGLDGADQKCADLAAAANRAGSWKAWISDASRNAFDRVKGKGPWYTFDEQIAVASHDEFQGSGITKAINVDEKGKTGVSERVWTGTSGDAFSQSCSNWTESYGFCFGICASAVVGNSGQNSSGWTAQGGTILCAGSGRLYCFQQ